MRTIVATVPLLLLSSYASRASAYEIGGGECGSVAPTWNAPRGAVVANRATSGPTLAIMNALHEARTHVQLSHGTNGWITQATMVQPSDTSSSYDSCPYRPVNAQELGQGYPGFSQTNLGGAYAFLSGAEFIRYQIPPDGANSAAGSPYLWGSDLLGAQSTADYAWINLPYQWTSSLVDGGVGLYCLWCPGYSPFSRIPYALHQFMSEGTMLNGQQYLGAVCSTAIPYTFARWLDSQPNPQYFVRQKVAPHHYTREQTIDSGNALVQKVYDM